MTPPDGHAARPAETLHTERLTLRRWTPGDVEAALTIHGNPDLARFVPSPVLRTDNDARRWLERIAVDDRPGRGWWLVQAGQVPVATILLKPIPASQGTSAHGENSPGDVEIGWRAAAEHTGRGYVSEAARLVLDEALAGGLRRVVAVTDPGNTSSQKVARAIGMQDGGLTRAYYDKELTLFTASRERPRRR